MRQAIGATFNWTSAIGLVLMIATLSGLDWLDRPRAGRDRRMVLLAAAAAAFLIPSAVRLLRLPEAPVWVVEAIDEWSNNRFRLRLIAGPRIAEYLRRLGEPAFEPLVFRVAHDFTRRGAWKPLPILVLVCMLGVDWLAVTSLSPAPRRLFIFPLVAGGWFGVLAAWAFCWPPYLRVVPGRLDTIRYGFPWRGGPETEGYDLSTAGVVVDARRRLLLIEESDGRRDLIHYGSIQDDLGFARAVLEAARSARVSPPLPVGALVG